MVVGTQRSPGTAAVRRPSLQAEGSHGTPGRFQGNRVVGEI